MRVRIADLDTAIAEREHNLRHREDAEAEVRYLESRRDEVKAEIAALEDGRVQLQEYETELQDLIEQLASAGVSAVSLEMIPRTT